MRTRTVFALLALLAVCVFATNAVASDRYWDAGGGADQNWSTAANWSSNLEPTASDRPMIAKTTSDGYTAVVTQSGEIGGGTGTNLLYVGCYYYNSSYTTGYGTLNIESGSLTIGSTAFWNNCHIGVGWTSASSGNERTAVGAVHQSGGTFELGSLLMGVNSTNAQGTYTLSGGTLTIHNGLYVGYRNDANTDRMPVTALVQISGSNPTFTVDTQPAEFGHNSILSYVMDSTGVSPIEILTDASTFKVYTPVSGVGGATLQLDFTAMSSAVSDILLVDNHGTDAISGVFEHYKVDGSQVYTSATFQDNVSVIKTFADSSYYTLTYAGGTGNDLVLVAHQIPEPAALALLAAGLVGLLAYAWRKRK